MIGNFKPTLYFQYQDKKIIKIFLGVQKSLDNAGEKIRQLEYELETERSKIHQNEFNVITLKKTEELMNETLKNELVELRNASIEKDMKIRMLEQLLEAATGKRIENLNIKM